MTDLPNLDELFIELEKHRKFRFTEITPEMQILLLRGREKEPAITFGDLAKFLNEKYNKDFNARQLAEYYRCHRLRILKEYTKEARV